MPSIFLSYSRRDLTAIQQLEEGLKANGVLVWRDQYAIYGGEKWPKVLGEAIAEQDFFLLAWSKDTNASHFVEFEWTTAVALKKTIIPWLLDGTPLPATLRATHAIDVRQPDEAARLILQSLRTHGLTPDPIRATAVMTQLASIQVREEAAVLKEVRSIFAAQQWAVQGNVYQAGGDIHIHSAPSPLRVPDKEKPLIEKWQTWAGLAVALLTAVTLLLDLPHKLTGSAQSAPLEQQLAGQVLDEVTGEPLLGVVVSLPDYDMKKTTESDGSFRFRVISHKQESVKFTAQKEGYKSYSNYATLGNNDLRFPLEKSE